MSDLFEIPSRHYAKLARRRVRKGYPEFDENQPRDDSGRFGSGGGGGGSSAKPKSEGSGAFGRAVAAAGGVAAVAAILAASGVPGVRNVPGLRQLRNKVLGARTRRAGVMSNQMARDPIDAVFGTNTAYGRHTRGKTQNLRNALQEAGSYKPSVAAQSRAARSRFWNTRILPGGKVYPYSGSILDPLDPSFIPGRPVRRR